MAPGRWEHSATRAKAPGPSGPGLAPWVRLAVHLLELKALVAVAIALGVAEVLTGGGPAALRGGLLRDGLGPPGAGSHALAEVLALHAQLLVAAGQHVPAGGPRALGPGGALGGSGQVSVLARPLGGESRENHCHIHCSGTHISSHPTVWVLQRAGCGEGHLPDQADGGRSMDGSLQGPFLPIPRKQIWPQGDPVESPSLTRRPAKAGPARFRLD